jgi:hypothetical protein
MENPSLRRFGQLVRRLAGAMRALAFDGAETKAWERGMTVVCQLLWLTLSRNDPLGVDVVIYPNFFEKRLNDGELRGSTVMRSCYWGCGVLLHGQTPVTARRQLRRSGRTVTRPLCIQAGGRGQEKLH